MQSLQKEKYQEESQPAPSEVSGVLDLRYLRPFFKKILISRPLHCRREKAFKLNVEPYHCRSLPVVCLRTSPQVHPISGFSSAVRWSGNWGHFLVILLLPHSVWLPTFYP